MPACCQLLQKRMMFWPVLYAVFLTSLSAPGMINVDFADVKTVMSEMGMAMMGTGSATGSNRAREATEQAVRNPLLEDVALNGARGILVNITAGPDLSLGRI